MGRITDNVLGEASCLPHVAWAKVQKALSITDAGTDIIFDDPVIHAVVSQLGGLDACRRDGAAVEGQFKAAYARASASTGFDFPAILTGSGIRDVDNLVYGNPAEASVVFRSGYRLQ